MGLTDWVHSVQGCWSHERNELDTALQARECVCSRNDCAFNMYNVILDRRRKLVERTGRRLEIGQPSPLGRFLHWLRRSVSVQGADSSSSQTFIIYVSGS